MPKPNVTLQRRIVETIRNNPEKLCVIEIAEKIGAEKHVVGYNIKKLAEKGVVIKTKKHNLVYVTLREA